MARGKRFVAFFSIVGFLFVGIAFGDDLGTAITYQGRLDYGGAPADGIFDLRFVLFDAEIGGGQVGSTIEIEDSTVAGGLFDTVLDFGAVFDGTALWLESAVRPGASTEPHEVLTPRQAVLATPYGIHALEAESADNAIQFGGQAPAFYLEWGNLTGVPAGLDDGDQDLLATLACGGTGKIARTSAGTWVCADDGVSLPLTESGSSAGSLIDIVNADGPGISATGGSAGITGMATHYDGNGVEGIGNHSGGHFADGNGSGSASVGFGDRGIQAAGNEIGGVFSDKDDSGLAKLAVGDRGIEAFGFEMGGHFEDADGTGYAELGVGDAGIHGVGSFAGGWFDHSEGTGHAVLGFDGSGIRASGSVVGGHFECNGGSGQANIGDGDYGIKAFGDEMGGYFEDTDHSGYAHIAHGNIGVKGYGSWAGGLFEAVGYSGKAQLARGTRGIEAEGSEMGGYFQDTDLTSEASVASGGYGIEASGDDGGGYFENNNGTGYAILGVGDYGIQAFGIQGGGYFEERSGSGLLASANVADGLVGINASGQLFGGHFEELNGSGWSRVAVNERGIIARGDYAGGSFEDTDSSAWAVVGSDTSKIDGTGTVNFVQNHPLDTESVIVYTSPEGDEVATYTRGSARLANGEARVPLGETFEWVTNPDIGLTAHVTPRDDCSGLYVAELSTEEILVREIDGGTSDCAFDFLVYGLRVGFEELSIVQEKQREAYIPAMTSHRKLYERRPDFRRYNSLERFKGMRSALGETGDVDLTRAHALRDAIVEFDPEVHKIDRPDLEDTPPMSRADGWSHDAAENVTADKSTPSAQIDQNRVGAAMAPYRAGAPREVSAESFRASADTMATLLPVAEPVEAGDVLAVDPASPGVLRKALSAADRGVVGIVASESGLVLGSERETGSNSGRANDSDGIQMAPVAFTGIVECKVDARYGAVWPGDLLVSSSTPGFAQRMDAPLPGTVIAKALEPLAEGTGTIRVVVMLR